MGVTLSHEHVFIDLTFSWRRSDRLDKAAIADTPVSEGILGLLRFDASVCKDNLMFGDSDIAVRELLMFKELGGRTVVDVTSHGLGPKPVALREVSKRTGLNIVAGTGYYVAPTHPPDVETRTIDELTGKIVRDIQEGLLSTDVRAGIIGEIGISYPVTNGERKVLRASARAHRSTGVAVSLHMPREGRPAAQILDILESEGADPEKIIVGHIDWAEEILSQDSFEYQKAVAERGVYLAFDSFGQNDYSENEDFVPPRDTERIAAIRRLIDEGYMDRILVSSDVSMKTYRRTFGGCGFDHIQRTVVPMMMRKGFTKVEIQRLTIDNPARAIAS